MKPIPHTLFAFIRYSLQPYRSLGVGLLLTAVGCSILGTLGPYAIKMLIDAASAWPTSTNPDIMYLIWPAILYAFVNVLIGANFRINDALRRSLFPRLHASVTHT